VLGNNGAVGAASVASAQLSADRTALTVTLLNDAPDPRPAIVTLLALGNATVASATATSLRSSNLAAANTAGEPTNVAPVRRDLLSVDGTTLSVALGSYDFTVVNITFAPPLAVGPQ